MVELRARRQWALFCLAASATAAPAAFRLQGETALWALSVFWIVLVGLAARRRPRLPRAVRRMALAFLVGCLPFLWTGRWADLRVGLTQAAYFAVWGGFELGARPRRRGRYSALMAVVVLTFAQAVGATIRHGLGLWGGERVGMNLVGTLGATAGIGGIGLFPSWVGVAIFLGAVTLVAFSGSRTSSGIFGIGLSIYWLTSSKQVKRKLFRGVAWALLVAGVAAVLLGRRGLERVPGARVKRAVTFSEWHREAQWKYWVRLAMDHPLGAGFVTVTRQAELPSHNALLFLSAAGGLGAAAIFVTGWLEAMISLFRRSKWDELGGLALALLMAASARMLTENFPLGTYWGFNGVLPLLLIGFVLTRAELETTHAKEILRRRKVRWRGEGEESKSRELSEPWRA